MPIRETRDLSELARTSGRKPDSYESWKRGVIFGWNSLGVVSDTAGFRNSNNVSRRDLGLFLVLPLGLASFSNPARYPSFCSLFQESTFFSKLSNRVPEFSLIGLAWVTRWSLSHLGYLGNEIGQLSRSGWGCRQEGNGR